MSCSQPGTVLFPREHVAMSGDTVGCPQLGAGGGGVGGGAHWHLWVEARGATMCYTLSPCTLTTPPSTNKVAPNPSQASAEKPALESRPHVMHFESGSEGALLQLCLLSELEMGRMMVKKSLPEISLLVQTILGARRKSQGDWEAPLSTVRCVGAARV